MQRWPGLDSVPPGWAGCVATIGVYDGVHRGHQATIARLRARADSADLPAAAVTFDPHPNEIVRPGSHPAVLTALDYKVELIAGLGVDALCVQPFTPGFAQIGAEEFVRDLLVGRLRVAGVVVGEKFRFGHRAAGDVALLRRLGAELGFDVEGVRLLTADGDGAPVSSTYIRERVAAGDLAAASWALTRPHRVDGVVTRGERRGRLLGFPTANVAPEPHSAIPADGVYAGWLVRAGGQSLPAATSVGTNPTFDGQQRTVEAYVLDAPDDLNVYGEHVGATFVRRLRKMVRFSSAEALRAQMSEDVEAARSVLRGPGIPPGCGSGRR